MKNNLFIIAKNGWRYIGFSVVVFLLFFILNLKLFALLFFSLSLFLLYLFRNPERQMPFYQKKSFVAPADGIITSIDEMKDKEYRYKIEIESSYMNVGVVRMPMDAKIVSVKSIKGSRVGKKSKLFTLLNEHTDISLTDDENNCVKIIHREKESFAPIDIDLTEKEIVSQNRRYGMMLNGVTTIYFKENFRINVNIGEKVTASETLIGYFL